MNIPGVGDGNEKLPLRILRDAEGLVETEFTHAHPAVESGDDLIELVLRGGLLDVLRQLPHLLADVLVVEAGALLHGPEILQHGEHRHRQRLFQLGEVIVEELLEEDEVMAGKGVHRTGVRPHFLRYQRKGSLRIRQQEGQIVVPEIIVEPVLRGKIQQPVDFRQRLLRQTVPGSVPLLETPADVRQTEQDAVLPDVAVDDEL